MDNANRGDRSHVSEAASDLLNEGKKWANEVREEGIQRACQAEENLKECSDELLKKVQQNPLTAVLMAGGIGFLLAKILRK
ncbi:MAG: hypothetical protein P4L79_01390 [Legionella sp.]|uniref:hypothetical protein n=1 Tax=Legionella sp. TaxID=459 RepID=UPI00284E0F19|nr:hypothetical protein [Legionella sp.]